MTLINFTNIILFGLYVLVSLLFLREFVDPIEWKPTGYGNGTKRVNIRRTYIVKKYLPHYAALIFITGVIFLI